MINHSEAEEHLLVIRSLLEKATIYRAISAPTALVGGTLSLLFGGCLYLRWHALPELGEAEFSAWFPRGWVAVLLVTLAANTGIIWREARRRQEPFISAGMRKALHALLPPMLCGGFATAWMASVGGVYFLPQFWMIFYGLALLATAHFAPRSIPILGWCFLIAGMAAFSSERWVRAAGGSANLAVLLMIGTFGIFHVVYAVCTWSREARAPEAPTKQFDV